MKFLVVVSSIVLLLSQECTGYRVSKAWHASQALYASQDLQPPEALQPSQTRKLIFDHGYVIAEGVDDFAVDYFHSPHSQILFNLKDLNTKVGQVAIGRPMADGMKMSFVLELTGSDERPTRYMEKYRFRNHKASSASLLDKVEGIFGDVLVRELNEDEQEQMDEYKQSKRTSIIKVVHENGLTRIQTHVEASNTLKVNVADGTLNLHNSYSVYSPVQNSASIMEINGKSFVIQDGPESNCKNLESLGIHGHCDGHLWIEKL